MELRVSPLENVRRARRARSVAADPRVTQQSDTLAACSGGLRLTGDGVSLRDHMYVYVHMCTCVHIGFWFGKKNQNTSLIDFV